MIEDGEGAFGPQNHEEKGLAVMLRLDEEVDEKGATRGAKMICWPASVARTANCAASVATGKQNACRRRRASVNRPMSCMPRAM